jgi:hypothetical protein
MQITQFLVGASYAALHSFVSYTIPVQVPNVAASVPSTSYVAPASAGFGDLIKKFLFRAAGEEGLAENVNGGHSAPQFSASATQEYRTRYKTIPCIDTSGQTFAIWLNVLYLAPLTVLFVRFFVKSYILNPAPKRVTATKAGKDALKGVERRLYENGAVNGKANGMNGHANGAVRM